MPENDSLQMNPSEARGLAVRRSVPLVEEDPRFAPGDYPASWAAGGGFSAYVHAFRRRWMMVVGLGLACGLLLAAAVWLVWGERFYTSALLHVATSEKPLVFRTADVDGLRFTPDAYDIYKLTQGQLIKTPFVLTAALGDERFNIDRSPLLRDEKDKVGWLTEELRVSFPGQAEIMEVGLRSHNKEEAEKIVNAVVKAYLREVVEKEGQLRRDRITELEGARAKVEEKVRRKRNELKNYAESLGTGDPETLALKQRIAVQDWADHQRQLAQVTFALRQAQGRAEGTKALLRFIGQREVTKAELDQLLRNDPLARTLYEELAFRRMDKGYTDSVVRPGAELRSVKRVASGVQFVEEQLDDLTDQLRQEFRQMKRAELTEELQAKQVEAAALEAQQEVLAKEVEAKKREAQSLGGSSVELEMTRADIENLDLVLANIAEEIERVRVELNAAPRVTEIQSAEAPETPVNFVPRLALTGLALVLGFCVPTGLMLFWDVRKRLVNSSEDVARFVGLPVAGSLPLVPRRLVQRLGAPTDEAEGWKSQLTESVDGVAGRLLRQAASDRSRVVLVTSAVGGEGKTSLATQLAMSLAHRGRKAVLVDCSLRRPAIGGVFDLPPGPGVSEFLRGEGELAVRSTQTQNLSVVTAGRWDRRAVTALAGDSAAQLFRRLREQYDFVVIDSSAVLPLADTRFIAQHADLALLCVMRDISQIAKVSRANDVLSAFGIEDVETAVVGSAEAGLPKPVEPVGGTPAEQSSSPGEK